MSIVRVAIIGVGHRGLAVFERVLSNAGASRRRIEVLLVEPHELGVGVHWRDQPSYLMLNTVASQATAFADPEMVGAGPVVGGPTFLEWCERRGVLAESAGGERRLAGAEDFLPRRVWGDYLAWAAERLLAAVPPWVTVRIHRCEARQVEPRGSRVLVTLDGADAEEVDMAFITTGHGVRSRLLPPQLDGEVASCFPLPAAVAEIPPRSRVAVSGMGLTAVDVTAALTVGRGGRFVRRDSRAVYLPSGDEPTIVLFSRSGRLPCARPERPRAAPKLAARHFTESALREARAAHPDGRLDFLIDVLPLIRAEILDREMSPEQRRLAESVLSLEPGRCSDAASYRREVIADAELDLAEAELGLEASAFKEAMESLRDLRQRLREVILPPGLTAAGHRDFFAIVPDLANRAAVGPQLERLRETLALIDAGVLELGPGPSPSLRRTAQGWVLASTHLDVPQTVEADRLVEAHLVWPRSIGGRDPLRAALWSWAAPHPADPRYLRLAPGGQVIARDGTVADGIVVLGPPSEGANYYNNYVLWPGSPSQMLIDVDAILRPLLEAGERDLSARRTDSGGSR